MLFRKCVFCFVFVFDTKILFIFEYSVAFNFAVSRLHHNWIMKKFGFRLHMERVIWYHPSEIPRQLTLFWRSTVRT